MLTLGLNIIESILFRPKVSIFVKVWVVSAIGPFTPYRHPGPLTSKGTLRYGNKSLPFELWVIADDIAEVHGLEARCSRLNFSGVSKRQLLKLSDKYEDHFSLSFVTRTSK